MPKTQGALHYKAQIIDTVSNNEPLTIQITSPLSQQYIEIVVQSENLISRKCSSQPLNNMSNIFLNIVSNFGLIISGLIALAVAIWGEFMICIYITFQSLCIGVYDVWMIAVYCVW